MNKDGALKTIEMLASLWAGKTNGDISHAFQIIAKTADGAVEQSVQSDVDYCTCKLNRKGLVEVRNGICPICKRPRS